MQISCFYRVTSYNVWENSALCANFTSSVWLIARGGTVALLWGTGLPLLTVWL